MTSFPALNRKNTSSHIAVKNVITGTTCIASSVPGVTPRVTSAAPTSAAGAASTPNINCLDVDSSPKTIIGSTDP